VGKSSEVALIVLGGVIGGLISVLDAWADPISYPLTLSKLASLLIIPGLKGGAAAGIGVYLLTQLDSTQLVRGFFFAVTCGLAFPSILSNGSTFSDRVTSQVASKTIAENVERLTTAGGSSSGPLSASEVAEIKNASIAILQASPKAPSSDMKYADSVLQQAVSDLGKSATESRDTGALEALTSIGSVAATHDSRGSFDAALAELKTLKAAPDAREDLRLGAATAIERIQGVARSHETVALER